MDARVEYGKNHLVLIDGRIGAELILELPRLWLNSGGIKMRILVNTVNRSNLVCINLYDWLWMELSKIADVKFWGPGRPDFVQEPLEATIKRLYGSDHPDWIIATAYMLEEHRRWVGWKAPPQKDRSWRAATFTSDIHANFILSTNARGYCQALNDAGWDAVIMLYTHLGMSKRPYSSIEPDYYPRNLKTKVFHCPPWTSPQLFKPSNEAPLYDASFMGAFERRQHPIRTDVWNRLPTLSNRKRWRVLLRMRPPGKANTRDIETLKSHGHLVGDAYADALARSRVFIFGNSIYKYPLLKIVEGWMAGACVMCDEPFTAKRMGMRNEENYLKIDLKNWADRLDSILKDELRRREIARNGWETAMKYHTAQVRARELLNWLEKNR